MSVTGDQYAIALDAEEQARANFYALLARLFFAPADDRLLTSIATSNDADEQSTGTAGSPEAEGSLDTAWRNLVNAAAIAGQDAVADEYDSLFVGSGRSDVSLYLGAYTARSSVDTKLVALREFLAEHGIQRQAAVHEPQDHVAMLFEVMRFLICEHPDEIEEQKVFFDQFIWSGAIALCDAISRHDRAQFFSQVAAFAKSFLLVEHDAFEM
jgi:TorA maturation chaperone TorD